ncbi:hypothetical protein [Nocardia huaxiensis]|uniref:Secreted protein n=1 Tax=Nocardia huaxiensis TaxID=2755382 RepID=A0A7D6Z3U1_9NOCA|nr:hypothetical protein [Nocardia huaxiensis]QLY30384.1 hypothetical protein H0264_35550 [Nocardia huaxiensis]UFS95977.1 hypothetical protein LPY97_35890 [Nocardia huaxiensis]
MKRSAVTTLLATAAILSAAPAVASADIVLTDAATTNADDPLQSEVTGSASGSANTGTSGGLATTGSTGTGSFGLPNLDKLLFGPFDTLCAVTGSASTILGKTSFGCDNLNGKGNLGLPTT